MRAALFLLLIGAAGISYLPSHDREKPDAFKIARLRCQSWLENDHAKKILLAAPNGKVSKESISHDYEEMRKALRGEVGIYEALKRIGEVDNSSQEVQASFLVAIWIEWRIKQEKGNLETAIADVGGFVPVRFKSEPRGATVSINGLARGSTMHVDFLSRKGKFHLSMAKDGFETWEKKGYAPPERGEVFDEKLKKK